MESFAGGRSGPFWWEIVFKNDNTDADGSNEKATRDTQAMRLPHEHLTARRIQAPVMRRLNGIELLNLIGEHGPISRASLAKISRLSKPTVSSQVETLIGQGWVLEVGQGESGERGGKKPMLVKFNADAGRLYAAEIDAGKIRVAVADLEGVIQERAEDAITADRRAEAVMGRLKGILEGMVRSRGAGEGLRVVTVAAPGRVDVRRGTVVQAGNLFNWSEVPVRAELEAALGVPVMVDNDVNMATLGEIHSGLARGLKEVVVVRLETGIGAGIVIRGKLLHGAHWAAGEIAHMVFDPKRATEEWRSRGYLESMVGGDRIVTRVREGTGTERELYEEVVQHLGMAVANLICAFDPGLVVLQGGVFRAVAERIKEVVAGAVPWETRIAVSEIAEDAVLLGAVAAARGQAYDRIARLLDEPGAGVVEAVVAR